MKGEAKMYVIPSNAEILGRELRRVRQEQAERQRIIREATLANPSGARKIWLILRDRWQSFRNQRRDRKIYPPVSTVPGNSHST